MKTTKGAITPSYCHNKNTIFTSVEKRSSKRRDSLTFSLLDYENSTKVNTRIQCLVFPFQSLADPTTKTFFTKITRFLDKNDYIRFKESIRTPSSNILSLRNEVIYTNLTGSYNNCSALSSNVLEKQLTLHIFLILTSKSLSSKRSSSLIVGSSSASPGSGNCLSILFDTSRAR